MRPNIITKRRTLDRIFPAHAQDEVTTPHLLRFSLRYKLAIPVLFLVFFLLAIVFYTTFGVVRDLVTKHKEARLETIAEISARTLKIPLLLGNQDALQDYAVWLGTLPNVTEVRVEGSDGAILTSTGAQTTPLPEALDAKDFSGVRRIKPDTYAAVSPIRYEQKTIGRLVIIFSKIELEKELQAIFQERFVIAFLLAVLVAIAIAGITWVVIQPLFVLQKTARSILAGNLEAQADIHSMDEIEELADAFNRVVKRLTQSFENLRLRTDALEESEEKYRTIVNQVSDIIFSITPEGELAFLNRGFSGYSREEILSEGLPLILSMHIENDAVKFQEALETIVRDKKPVTHLATRHFHKIHHNEIYYLTNLTPVVDYVGNLRFVQGVMRDVTELRRVEMMKETLVRDVAHELKTPTAKFAMTVNWLERQMIQDPDKGKYLPTLKMLKDNADRLLRTISSIMDLSKIEAGMSEAPKHVLDLNDVLHSVLRDMKPFCEQNHLTLEASLSAVPLKMLGDLDMLYRLFVNLVGNAVKFTPSGKITISSSLKGNDVHVEVADTGIGIEEENLKKVFDAFFQKTPSTVGIGVGLTISKEIVSLHEGEIWAESPGLGKGSIFKVEFPAYQEAKKSS